MVDAETGSTKSKEEVLRRAVAKCPEVEICLEGVPYKCLIDTGSQVTTVTESFFRNLLQSKPELHDVTKWMRITGANHLDIPYIGYIEINLEAFGECVENVGVLVVKDPTDIASNKRKTLVPGILGSNAFSLFKQKMEPSSDMSRGLDRGWKELLTLYEMSCSATVQTEHVSYVTVFGKTPVKIPAVC